MFNCAICGIKFNLPYLLNRHHEKNKRCKEHIAFTKTINEMRQSLEVLERREEKYHKLKNLSKQVLYEKRELQKQNKELLTQIKLLKSYHRAELAETKCDMYEKAGGSVKNSHNTIINNNTTIIQDFSIKPASAFNVDTKELTDIIYNKDILEVCKYILEKYYWTLPPNIRVADQARKKIFVAKGNKWIQENVKELSHQLFHQSLKPMADLCINEKIYEHKDFVDNPINVLKPDERDQHFDELLKWDAIKQLWDNFDSPNLQGTLMMSVDNLTNKLKN